MASETSNKRRRGRGEGAIYQRPTGRWQAQVRLSNGKKRSKTFDTRKEAQKWMVESLKAREDGMLAEAGKITLGQFLDRWLEDVARPTIKPKTYESYAWLISTHISPVLGKHLLSALRPDHLQAFYTAKSAGLAPRTVRYMHAILHRALRQAMQWSLVPRNVADLASPPRLTRQPMRTLDADQVRLFLEATKEDALYPLYVMAITTGMRRGELLGLHWKDVDLESGTIHVVCALQRLKGRGLVITEPKSAKGRRAIAMAPSLIQVLRQHRVRQLERRLAAGAAWQDQDLVFCSTIGTPLDERNVYGRFKQRLHELGLPDIRFHDLRHTAATLLLAGGIHPKVAQEMLGHSSITLTLDTYSHVLPDMQREAANQMEAMIQGGRSKKAEA